MNSKERMLAAIECRECDYVPCSFMGFFNLCRQCATEAEFVDRQLALGLDAYVHVGRIQHSFHPDVKHYQWVERKEDQWYYCRRIETPKGPLTQRLQQRAGWPQTNNFSIFDDYVVTRAREILVKPEADLEKLEYLFGAFRKEAIEELRESAREANRKAGRHGLLQIGGWCPSITGNTWTDGGVMGCDCMAWLSGYEQIMLLSMTKPEIVKEYANIIHRWNMKQIEIYLEVTAADIIWRRGWYETVEFWTPDAYSNIIAPTLKAEAQLAHQAGKKFGYIITSAFVPLLDDILDADIDVLIGIDPKQGKGTELRQVKDRFLQRRKALWGGVSGPMTLEVGTEAETEQAVVEALKTLGRGGGLILSPVDNVREDTERAWNNTQVFIDTWKANRKSVL